MAHQRRVERLFAHLVAAGTPGGGVVHVGDVSSALANVRPGDDDADVVDVDTSPFIEGAFRPRADEADVEFAIEAVEGSFPVGLSGTLLRIGPNPRFDFSGKPYHPFDGDGMIHSVCFSRDGSTARYVNKWVRTKALENEASKGYSFSVIGEMNSLKQTNNFNWVPHVSNSDNIGRANTALAYHEGTGRLFALFEVDYPYEVEIDSLETLGRVEAFAGEALKYATFTAHPKVCATTGEMIFFGYINGPKDGPWLHYGVVSASGELVRNFPVRIPAPVMMHDLAITKNYSIFFDYNLRYNDVSKLMSGEAQEMYVHAADIPARFGVLPRYARSDADIIWIDTSPCVVFHFAGAFEEADGKHITIVGSKASAISLENIDSDDSGRGGFFSLWRLNIETGKCVEEKILAPGLHCDFAQIPADMIGKKIRYAYAATFCAGFTVDGVVKFDLLNGTSNVLKYPSPKREGTTVYGGESMFVRRSSHTSEDDGWLLSFTYNDPRCPSSIDIVDAKTMRHICRVALPKRVPAGFHAAWVGS